MALSKETRSIPFAEGPDTKTDPKLSMKPAQLTNAVFRGGTIQKRPGRQSLTTAITTGGNQSAGEALSAFNQELLRINGGVAYGLAEATNQWVPKEGGNNYCLTSLKSLINQASGSGSFDHAVANGVGVVAWAQNGMHVAVYDVETGVFYQTGATAITSSPTNSTNPRLLVLGTKVVLVWASHHLPSGDLYSAVINTASPTTAPTAVIMVNTDLKDTAGGFDGIAYSGALGVVVYPSDDDELTLIGVDDTGTVTASPAPTTIATGGADSATGGLLIQRDTAGNIYVVLGDPQVPATKYYVRGPTFASVLGATAIVTGTNWNGDDSDFTTGASIEMVANQITLVLSRSPPNIATFLGTAVIGPAGVVTAFSTLPATAGLAIVGDAVAYDGTAVLAVVNTDGPLSTDITGLQSTAFVINLAGKVVAKGLTYQTAHTVPGAERRVARGILAGNTAQFLFWQQGRIAYKSTSVETTVGNHTSTALNIIPVTTYSLAQLSVVNTGAQPVPLVRVGESLYLGGGYPRIYDGLLLGEFGFTLYPTVVTVVDGGAGSLSAGTYQWRFLFSWVGANGELIRGPVSPPQTLSLAAGREVDITLGTMPLAMRDLIVAGGNSRIEIYRTEANGTVFYRQSSVLDGPQNVTDVPTAIVVTDDTSDAALVVGEVIYTSGGVLDWEAPPPYSAACAHKNRLIVLPSEDPYAWAPSSQWVAGETVRFSTFTVNHVPSDKGPLVAVASMDGKLILFATGGAFVIIGDGPDLLGAGNFPPPERIASVDAGPLPGTPVVETMLGLMYQSPSGIQLLDRGLNVQDIGASMEEFTLPPYVLRSAVVDTTNQEVRFLLDPGSDITGALLPTFQTSNGGVCLVFNYFYGQWSVLENYGGQAATFYQKRYTMVRSDGVCWQEQPGTFRDDGAYYTMTVEGPWWKTGGPQGVQRIWYAMVLGTWGSDCTFKWEVAFDYEGTSPRVPTWSLIAELDGTGEYALGGPFKVRKHVGHRNEAIKFRFSDEDTQGDGAGVALSDLTLEVGVKKGAFKLPTAQTAKEV